MSPNDAQARHHYSFLCDTGALSHCETTWPLPWAEVHGQLQTLKVHRLNEAQLWSYRLLKHRMDRASRTTSIHKYAYIADSPLPYLGFGDTTRERGALGTQSDFVFSHLSFSLGLQRPLDNPDDDDLQFEGSQISWVGDQWIVGIGALPRWWGPGWNHSITLSHNPTPDPALFLKQKAPRSLTLPKIGVLGRWTGEIFLADRQESGNIEDAKIMAGRVTLSPHSQVTIGINKLRESYDFFAPSQATVVPPDESSPDEVINRVGGDWRIGTGLNALSIGVYGQYTRVSSDDGVSSHGHLHGASLAWGGTSSHHRIGLEFSEQNMNTLLLSERLQFAENFERLFRPATAGYGDEGSALGAFGEHFFSGGQHVRWRFQAVRDRDARVRDTRQVASFSLHWPLNDVFRLQLGAVFLSDAFVTKNDITWDSSGSIGLDYAF